MFYSNLRLTNTCQSKQLRGKLQAGVRMWNSWSPYCETQLRVCTMWACGWLYVQRERWKKKENTCSVLFCTSAQSFEMQMTIAYWKIVVFWDKWALQELKPCFSLRHSEATFCIMHSDCVFVYTHKYDKAFDFVFILNSKQKRMTFSLCAGLISQPVPHFFVCLLCAAQCRSQYNLQFFPFTI